MDPDACLARILSALEDKRYEEAKDACSDLLEWKNKGGFKPQATECPILIFPGLFEPLHEIDAWLKS
jgi:hypothetical protein